METEPSKVEELKKKKETAQKIDPDLATNYEGHETLEPKESEEKPNPTLVSSLDMILKSLWKISVFTKELPSFTEDEYVSELRDFFLNDPTLAHPMETNAVSELLVTILELLPRWRNENGEKPLNSHFELLEETKKICNRCKMDTEYPVERSYGLTVAANSLREFKSAFEDFTFENILKVIRITLMMPCDKEGCGKRSYVDRMINKLPYVFTIALEWENNETEGEMLDTTSALATVIDISAVYKYEGDNLFTKYRLVSMVCFHGDEYNCVAYENKRWVRHFGSKKEVIGDWDSVLRSFVKLNMRPEILYFENIMVGSKIVFGSLGKRSKNQ
ncbi:uncharacterized protein LOC18013842 isoform X2 [Eutrema salsugineum]|uniref:uncharacterized protein LOC18013842 isoform X2 n=1 Tax=Eutrema salsugineum TaxID=72664 RepID=UPI000CED045E|nr:uncharacterized protein LOC18013842 isoform X2 [Eutrema salsugineum]